MSSTCAGGGASICRVGDKRKALASPSPPRAPSLPGTKAQQAGKRARWAGRTPSVAVPVKKEAVAAAALLAATFFPRFQSQDAEVQLRGWKAHPQNLKMGSRPRWWYPEGMHGTKVG